MLERGYVSINDTTVAAKNEDVGRVGAYLGVLVIYVIFFVATTTTYHCGTAATTPPRQPFTNRGPV